MVPRCKLFFKKKLCPIECCLSKASLLQIMPYLYFLFITSKLPGKWLAQHYLGSSGNPVFSWVNAAKQYNTIRTLQSIILNIGDFLFSKKSLLVIIFFPWSQVYKECTLSGHLPDKLYKIHCKNFRSLYNLTQKLLHMRAQTIRLHSVK